MANPGYNNASDALRNMRRFLNGRGVNYRRALITGPADATTTVYPPGLGAHDEIISVLRYVTGGAITELNYETAGAVAVQATKTLQADLIVVAQSEYPGSKGNSLRIETLGGASKSLAVTVTGFLVSVQLATDSGSAITSTYGEVAAAIEAHPEARRMLDVKFDLAATAAEVVDGADAAGNLTGGVDAEPENVVKVVTAAVQASLTLQADIIFTASGEYVGTKGNGATGGLRLETLGGASKSLAVTVTGRLISIQLATDSGSAITSTYGEVAAAIEAHPEARRMVDVKFDAAATAAEVVDGADAAADFASGADEKAGIQVGKIDAVDASMDTLVVDYLTKVH